MNELVCEGIENASMDFLLSHLSDFITCIKLCGSVSCNYTGMDWRHSDLRGNYVSKIHSILFVHSKTLLSHSQDSQASRDFIHYDSDPTPDWNSEEPNSHGTECAGVVGMARNGICGVGVAHDANIGCE